MRCARECRCSPAAVLVLVAAMTAVAAAYYRSPQAHHSCVDIPRNLSLCHGIGYDKMRLPNLLDHDTVLEVTQQAVSWVPLQNVHCHSDTQLFLCALFSPVCLDHPIYPCRSLCERVRRGCEGRMRAYGFPWPDMFHCDKFPVDNDMCIASRAASEPPPPPPPGFSGLAADSNGGGGGGGGGAGGGGSRHQLQVFNRRLYPPKASTSASTQIGSSCKTCDHVETYENILDNFCTADFVIRTRFKRVHKGKLNCKKVKVLKKFKPGASRNLRRPVLILDPPSPCCVEKIKKFSQENYLVMGHVRGSELVPSFIMRWLGKTSKVFKQAVRTFKSLNCSDPSHSVLGDVLRLDLSSAPIHSGAVLTQRDVQYPFSTPHHAAEPIQ